LDVRILVAGASGALGRFLVPRLLADGHQVVGTSRSEQKAELIRHLGAEAAVADGLDAESVRGAVHAAQPDVIVHQMTSLEGTTDLRHFDRVFAVTNRLRTSGTDHLISAGRDAGVKRFVAQSYCGWPYARMGGSVKTEEDPLDPKPPKQLRRALEAIRYLETAVTQEPVCGIILRYGAFYGPNSGMLDDAVLEQLARRRMPMIGDGGGWWSFIHLDDAAAATVAAIERGRPGNIYNIVDDEPAQVRTWLPGLATLLGAKRPRAVPAWVIRLVAGKHLVAMMTQIRAGSNAKAKRELGWEPACASWRQGFAEVVGQRRGRRKAAR
jgi:2-alkyl-3-oxoalkanoate reductase